MAEEHYCALFDHRYAPQGFALIESLRQQGGEGPIWILCLDRQAEELVCGFDQGDLRVISIDQIESHFGGLADARTDRTLLEYYYTLTPHLISYVFDHAPEARRVAYIDGDMFFFGPVSEMWMVSALAPAVIIPHNFSCKIAHLAKYGTYNVGWVGFARSEEGLACLQFWTNSCRDWCRSQLDSGRFADQGYLDQFSRLAPNLAIVQHKGCNAGPWNIARYEVQVLRGKVHLDADRLIFFHFSGFKKGFAGRWYSPHRFYRSRSTRAIRDHIYRPYLTALTRARTRVAELAVAIPDQSGARAPLQPYRGGGSSLKAKIYLFAQRLFQILDFLGGHALAEEPVKR